jgi:death on curing protein
VSLLPEFLSIDDVLDLHAQQIDRYGGSPGVRERSLLESATMTPQASFGGTFVHDSLFAMAAAYAFHIAENQPFVDGNKRAALASCLVFLELNGVSVSDPKGELYEAMIAVSARALDKVGLAKLLERLAEPI